MTTHKEALLELVQAVREEMHRVLDGMDYCIDWRPEEGEWSVREVLYHLVDTPEGGLHSVAGVILRGEIQKLDIVANVCNITPERRNADLSHIIGEVEAILGGLEELVSNAAERDLDGTAIPIYSPSRDATEVRSVADYIGRSLSGHWREHLDQMAALREGLGLD